MINFFSKHKIFFYIANFVLIFLYLFPGSLIGCFLYNDCRIQPEILNNIFLISFNHVLAFLLLTIIACLTYSRYSKINLVFFYLILLSIILEVLHIFVPERGFELADVIGNLLGIFIIFITHEFFKRKKYKK